MMEYKGYLGQAQFDDEANIFHGEVINIRDVITFQGRSVEELQQTLADSIEDYLAFCAELGEEPERPSGAIDATAHLLRSEANRKRLLAAIENINAGRNLVEAPMDMLH